MALAVDKPVTDMPKAGLLLEEDKFPIDVAKESKVLSPTP